MAAHQHRSSTLSKAYRARRGLRVTSTPRSTPCRLNSLLANCLLRLLICAQLRLLPLQTKTSRARTSSAQIHIGCELTKLRSTALRCTADWPTTRLAHRQPTRSSSSNNNHKLVCPILHCLYQQASDPPSSHPRIARHPRLARTTRRRLIRPDRPLLLISLMPSRPEMCQPPLCSPHSNSRVRTAHKSPRLSEVLLLRPCSHAWLRLLSKLSPDQRPARRLSAARRLLRRGTPTKLRPF